MDNKEEFGYMCKIDWDWELGHAMGGNRIFPDVDDLKKEHPCWENCGIVKVKIALEETVVDGRR